MKKYVVELKMQNDTDGYYLVVVEGEKHLNRTQIKSSIQFFTRQSGYDYNHPESRAKENAEAIAFGLNSLESGNIKHDQEFDDQDKALAWIMENPERYSKCKLIYSMYKGSKYLFTTEMMEQVREYEKHIPENLR